ncbi:hypothetical protein DM813_28290 [Pseudomonas alkylphenolica]|uniref:PIN domain-containing protein n=1 Tax=Pseudomonas alkylphenolica TaxID=237609 RepID=A0A443ZEY1_9PSED|nr:hypothetical protein DM813_28290 [Pseudomonas alkylphenolica]
MLAMCLGIPCAGIRDNFTIVELLFQGRPFGHNTDDLIIFTARLNSTQRARHNLQMKRSLRASDNPTFIEAVGLAWLDFKRPDFTRESDDNVIVYDASSTSAMKGAVEVVSAALASSSAESWYTRVNAEKVSNASNRAAYAAIKLAVEQYSDEPVEADELHQFVVHLRFLRHDLDSDRTAEVANQKQLIKQAMPWADPSAIWAQMVSVCSELNGLGGELSLATLKRFLGDAADEFELPKLWRTTLTSAQSSPLSINLEVFERLRPLVETLSPLLSQPVVVDTRAVGPEELPSSQPCSASSIYSRQLDRVKQLHSERRYREALTQLETLQEELDDFDSHQRARWHFLRGMCNWHLAEDELAARDLETAAALYADDDRIAAGSVRALLLRNQVNAALEAGKALNAKFPESFAVWQIVTNARVMNREVLTAEEIPAAFVDMAAPWQMLASSRASQDDDAGAVSAIEIALEKTDASIFILESYLRLVVRLATQNAFHVKNRWQPEDRRELLESAIARFADREKVLWSEQSVRVQTDIVFHLAYAFLLLAKPAQSLGLIEQGRERGVPEHAASPRIEMEALRDLGRDADLLARFEGTIEQLDTDTLVSFGQSCLIVNRDDLLQATIAEVTARMPVSENDESEMVKLVSTVLHQLHWELLLREKQADRVREELEARGITPASTSIPHLVFAARAYIGDDALRKRYEDRVAEIAKTCTVAQELSLASQLMLTCHRYDAVVDILERLLPTDAYTLQHDDLIQCYAALDKRVKLRDLLDSLASQWRVSKDARQAALHLYGNAGDWPRMLALIEQDVVEQPDDAASWLLLVQVSANTHDVNVGDVLARVPSSLIGSTEALLRLGSIEIMHGHVDRGIDRIYRAMRSSAGENEAAALHLMIMITTAKAMDEAQTKPLSIAPGTTAELEGAGGDSGHISIDLAQATQLPPMDEFIPPDSAQAAALLGLKVGDEVGFPGLIGQQQYRIKRIITIHQRLVELSNQRILTAMVPNKMLAAMKIPRLENGDYDLSYLIEQLERRKAQGLHTLNLYKEHAATLGLIGRLIGVDAIDLVREWPAEETTLEVTFERGDMSDPFGELAPDFAWVVDLSMLVELSTLGMLDVLEHLPNLYVSSATRLALAAKADKASRGLGRDSMYAHEGKIGVLKLTEEDWENNLAYLEAITATVDGYCKVVPAYGPSSAAPVDQLKDIVSDEDYSTLLVCLEYGAGLLSLDGRLRLLAKTMGVNTASPQMLLNHAAVHKKLRWPEYSCAMIKMIISRRNFIGIDTADLIAMMDQGPVFANRGLNGLRTYLATPLLTFSSAVPVLNDFVCDMYLTGRCDAGVMLQLIEYCFEPMFRHPDCPQDWQSTAYLRLALTLPEARFNELTWQAVGVKLAQAKVRAGRPARPIEFKAAVTWGPWWPFYATDSPSQFMSTLLQDPDIEITLNDRSSETQAKPDEE